jgi:hypothetical protein
MAGEKSEEWVSEEWESKEFRTFSAITQGHKNRRVNFFEFFPTCAIISASGPRPAMSY